MFKFVGVVFVLMTALVFGGIAVKIVYLTEGWTVTGIAFGILLSFFMIVLPIFAAIGVYGIGPLRNLSETIDYKDYLGILTFLLIIVFLVSSVVLNFSNFSEIRNLVVRLFN